MVVFMHLIQTAILNLSTQRRERAALENFITIVLIVLVTITCKILEDM